MKSSSRRVQSNQSKAHPDLQDVVKRHFLSSYKKPVASHSQAAFDEVAEKIGAINRPLVLDGGCGTGESTVWLAHHFPKAWVIGIDRSASRLGRRAGEHPDNAIIVRANLEDFWRLAEQAEWRFQAQFLFYPNPYPKKQQLNKRWHGHAVLPAIVACGGHIEVRTNWAVYAWEFGRVLEMIGAPAVEVAGFRPTTAVSRFEKKYQQSGHKLYKVTGVLPEEVAIAY